MVDSDTSIILQAIISNSICNAAVPQSLTRNLKDLPVTRKPPGPGRAKAKANRDFAVDLLARDSDNLKFQPESLPPGSPENLTVPVAAPRLSLRLAAAATCQSR